MSEDSPFSFFFGRPPTEEEIAEREMQSESNGHELRGFFYSLNEEQLTSMLSVIQHIKSSSGAAGTYYQGIIGVLLEEKFKVCMGCGKKHDDELQAMINSTVTNSPEPSQWTDLQPPEPVMGTDLYDGYMRAFNMEPDDDGSEHVMCKGCRKWYENLADRMKRPAGPEGCEGCVEKTKWG